MPWQVPVVLRLIAAYVITQPLAKKLMSDGKGSRTQKFALMYGGALFIAIVYALSCERAALDVSAAWLFGVGFLVSFGTFCWWGAANYSFSKNALLTVWDDIIAMAFGFFLLGERRMLNGWVGAGILLSLVSLIQLFRHSQRKKREKEEEEKRSGSVGADTSTPLKFYLYVAGYSVAWGLAAVAMRYFGTEGVSQSTFLLSWYAGTMTGATILLLSGCEIDPTCTERLTKREVWGPLVLGAMIIVSLFLEYWSYASAPLVVVRPIYLVGEQVIPMLIGLYIFKEAKHLDRKEKRCFAAAILGGLLLFFGEHLGWLIH